MKQQSKTCVVYIFIYFSSSSTCIVVFAWPIFRNTPLSASVVDCSDFADDGRTLTVTAFISNAFLSTVNTVILQCEINDPQYTQS